MRKTEECGTLNIELEDVHLRYHRGTKILWVNVPTCCLPRRGLFRIDLTKLLAEKQDAVKVYTKSGSKEDRADICGELTIKLVDVEINYIKLLKVLWVNRPQPVGRSSFRVDLNSLMAGDEDAIKAFDKTGTLIKEDEPMGTKLPVCPQAVRRS